MLPLVLGSGVEPIAVALRGLMLNSIANSPAVYRNLEEEIRLAVERGTNLQAGPVDLRRGPAISSCKTDTLHTHLRQVDEGCFF